MKKLLILSAIFLVATISWGFAQEEVSPKALKAIQKQLRKMQSSAKANQMQGVADMYLDQGYLLSAGAENITGRAQINEYWLNLKNVLDWKLESKLFAMDAAKIYAHPHYQQLKNKPPDWKDLYLDLQNVVYELGVSSLTITWEGKPHTSVVTYILLWQKQTDGNYRILVDTYSGE